ncbi:uncharacterized protein GIQ15_00535 [Arthroderma uncinatum]|uniref:uncharacterized protein n=1 Tax=Arthroderma uncinatum TaxID=74035 RepID=UPI00144A60A4|nr:uncharacterized protein GIQ15_00535 [Arthroderma uncinatum]KAF3491018.1 hypothetical protein GIQ15_00535 [Arthroderma uncinatum]
MSSSHMQAVIVRRSTLMSLSNEILCMIAEELNTIDLARIVRCNKRLNTVITRFLYRYRVKPYLWLRLTYIKPGHYAYNTPVSSWPTARLTRTYLTQTPLEWAALTNQVNTIKRMIGYNPDPRVFKELQAGSAMELAAMVGNAPALKAILDTRTGTWPRRKWGCYPMHQAAFNGYIDAIQVLIDARCPIDKRDDSKMTALAVATVCQKVAAAEFLLANGARRSKLSQDNQICLHVLLGEPIPSGYSSNNNNNSD